MLSQTIASNLLTDLSTDEQQFLAGGFGKYSRRYGCNGGGSVGSTQESTPAPTPVKARLVVGHIITVTPFVKCLNGYSGTNGGGAASSGESTED